MFIHRFVLTIFLMSSYSIFTWGQADGPSSATSAPSPSVPLVVPEGTPIPVILDKEVRIQKVGQPIRGKVAEPIYAYDKLVIPAGSEVTGKVSRIEGVSSKTRTVEALNANFSPSHNIEIEFDELALADGQRFPLQTVVSPASQGVLQFATAADLKAKKENEKKDNAAKKLAAKKLSETRQQINQDWEMARKQMTEPGKIHRLERFAIAQLPYHPQYMDAGTRFNAELQKPLDFGSEALTPEMVNAGGSELPPGSVVHALLLTPLNSAESQKGAPVEVIVTEPLFAANQLVLPQGTHIRGSVLQVQPARRMKKNGQLRIVFHQIVPPNAPEQKVEASLEGVEAKSDEHLTLDSEGGAQVTTPKTRYLTTGISIALAATSFAPDADAGQMGGQSVGETGGRALKGASGFRVIGLALGLLVHSRVMASGFGVYGAGMSVYSHFLTRGQDVVYPKDTVMVIGIGSRVSQGKVPAENHAL
jgi:type IV secretory pathway VirB10-like protein